MCSDKLQYNQIRNLFLSQSYQDAWDDYETSLKKAQSLRWDYVFLTASNEAQAESYRTQINNRQADNVLPITKYIVLSDPDGKRVGSGGATFNVLKCLADEITRESGYEQAGKSLYSNKRILVIHSGGDSKRIPQYSAIGKLFSPVPRFLPDGRPSTLFDELIIGTSGIPSRISEGMLVMSGDALLLINPLQIDVQLNGAAALSVKEPVTTGKNHGVFLGDGQGYVRRFLHKQSEHTLRACEAVNDQDAVDLDTGAILLGTELLDALWGLISVDGQFDKSAFNTFVNESSRVSFYGDFLYPLASDSSLEQFYKEKPEGDYTDELRLCREKIWNAISNYRLRLIPLSPARFIHFGTTKELSMLMTEEILDYHHLGWNGHIMSYRAADGFSSYSSYIGHDTAIERKAYIENSYVLGTTHVGEGSIVSNVKLRDVSVPAGVVVHGLPLQDGRYICRIYDVHDNPKEKIINGKPLWDAALYPIADSLEEAVDWALWLYQTQFSGSDESDRSKKYMLTDKLSLNDSYNLADVTRILKWQKDLQSRILTSSFIDEIVAGSFIEEALQLFGKQGITQRIFELLMLDASEAGYSVAMRIYYGISRYMKSTETRYMYRDTQVDYDYMEQLAFSTIKDVVVAGDCNRHDGHVQICQEYAEVRLPVRVNFGGGWTDTPPYCLENGGAVLNASITLNGIKPIRVEVRRLDEFYIELESSDVGVHQIFNNIDEIRNCSNPYDAFALHKAAIMISGIIPPEGDYNLEDVMRTLGGGIYLSTQAEGVPKGSGLGTSSILSAACIQALSGFLGLNWSDGIISSAVMRMEQLMSTGGGWQDQIGGLIPGFKLITSDASTAQQLHIETLDIPAEALDELNSRFALVYTGQRRLARNLLREVCGGYIGSRPESLEALKGMKELAYSMADALKDGDIDLFASLMEKHWQLSCMLDKGTTNNCIDHIFISCKDMIEARFIAGAGGGGFAMVMLKKGVTKQELRDRLRAIFQDSGVDVWDSEFLV